MRVWRGPELSPRSILRSPPWLTQENTQFLGGVLEPIRRLVGSVTPHARAPSYRMRDADTDMMPCVSGEPARMLTAGRHQGVGKSGTA